MVACCMSPCACAALFQSRGLDARDDISVSENYSPLDTNSGECCCCRVAAPRADSGRMHGEQPTPWGAFQFGAAPQHRDGLEGAAWGRARALTRKMGLNATNNAAWPPMHTASQAFSPPTPNSNSLRAEHIAHVLCFTFCPSPRQPQRDRACLLSPSKGGAMPPAAIITIEP